MFNILRAAKERGITLIEIVVVIFIIVLFTLIIISDFPKILRQSSLSRVTYKLTEDLRRAQDLGLSGVKLSDSNSQAISIKGYGIYINTQAYPTKYIIYADVADSDGSFDQQYTVSNDIGLNFPLCSDVNQITEGPLASDCVLEIIDISKENPSLSIKNIIATANDGTITNINSGVSINFSPPTPITNIEDDSGYAYSTIGIVLQNTDGITRTVSVNQSGLINVQ